MSSLDPLDCKMPGRLNALTDPFRQRVRDRAHIEGPMKRMGGMLNRCDRCSFPLFDPTDCNVWRRRDPDGTTAEHIYLCAYCDGEMSKRKKG